MQLRIVDISDFIVSDEPSDRLITYSLGSCLGVTVHDPLAGVGGMIHCMLPQSKLDTAKAEQVPAMFVDTGVALLFNRLFRLGARKQNVRVALAGAARVLQGHGMFHIGERNIEVCGNILKKNNISVKLNATGGQESRTIALDVESGTFTIRCRGEETVYELSG